MGFQLVNPRAPGAGPHYHCIRAYTPFRMNDTITGQMDVYRDAAARSAFKAAETALKDLAAQVKVKMTAIAAALAAFDALSVEERDQQRAAHQASMAALTADVEALKQQQSQQTVIFSANKAVLIEDYSIPPGQVPVASTGAVTLDDQYTWLMANTYHGAERVN